jgi:hypothetical protein
MTRSLALSVALLAGGCCLGGGSAPEPVPEPIPDWMHAPEGERIAPPPDDLFVYANVSRLAGASAPARLHAAIPSTLATFRAWPDDAAPRNQVQARLSADDPETVSAWLEAATSAAHDAPANDVASAYASLVRYADGAIVSDLRRRASTTPAPGAHETVWLALAMQGDAQDEALFTSADAPPAATVAWFGNRWMEALSRASAARLLRALEAHLAATTPSDDVLDPCGEGLARAMGALENAGRVDDLLALGARLTGAHADCLGISLENVADPRAQALFVAACPRVVPPGRCAVHEAPVARAAATARATTDDVRAYDFDPTTIPRTGPRFDAAVSALATCANDASDTWGARGCLVSLAALDRPRAVTIARAWLATQPDAAPEAETQRALDAFPETGSVVAYLRERGLVSEADDVSMQGGAIAPESALEGLGHATRFDTETDQYPNEHDTLLVQLAALAPAALRGVVFEEIVRGTPGGVDLGGGLIADGVTDDEGSMIEGDAPEGDYLLHAYDDHARYEVSAENLGDWYDVDAVIGLLNVVAHEHGSDVRWLMLETGDQTAIVVAGPAAGLRQMVADHWLVPSGLGASAASREAERVMLEQILGGH